MTVLVTGGSGFIGRHLVSRLIARWGPEAVTCLVHESDNPARTVIDQGYAATGIRLLYGDLLAPNGSASRPPKPDVVFHLAANIDTDAPADQMRVNDEGTTHLLDWLGEAAAGARIVFASSVAVADRTGPAAAPLDEESPCVPRTAYGASKLRAEHILRDRAATGGFTYTILRLPTVYGQGQKAGGLFDRLASLASSGALAGRLDWPGRTSVLHVDDAVSMLVDVAGRADMAGATYYVAADEAPTVGQLSRAIGHVTGHPVRPVRPPSWIWGGLRRLIWSPLVRAMLPRRLQVAYWRLSLIVDDGFWVDTRRFRRAYTEPVLGLEEGLRRTFQDPIRTPRP